MTGDNRTFADMLNAAFPDALGYFEDTPADSGPPLQARKLSMYAEVSCCYLTDTTGENHCQHPPIVVPPVPWTWRRARNHALGLWWDLRERAGRVLAGRRWPDEEE